MTKKALLSVLMALMGTGLAWSAEQSGTLTNPIYGAMVGSADWNPETGEAAYGLYSFDGNTFDPIVTDPYLQVTGGGTYVNGRYCYNYNFFFMGEMAQNLYLLYDFETEMITGWELFETTYADVATQVAYDETSGQVYGQFYSRDKKARVWGTRDIEMGETKPIRTMVSLDLCALAFDHLGRAWAVDEMGNLLQIDKLSGQQIMVGNTGLNLAKTTLQSGAIDPTTGTFYMFAVEQSGTSALYTIDLTTAQATKVTDLPANEQIAGAYFMPLTYDAAVPAAATEMKVTFGQGALQGNVSGVAPAVAEDGKVLTEGALLTLTLDGEKVGEVQTTPGQTVSFDVTVEKSGTHVFQFVASNGTGQGRPTTIHQWIGIDIPEAVNNLKAQSTDNTHALLTWTAPTTGVHGGYIDPAHLRYSIIDSDNTLVASGLTDTQYEVSKSGSRLTARTYSVIAFTDSEAGLSATTNRVYFGNRYKVPYSTYFDTQAEYDLWAVLDANDDGSTWSYDSYNRYVKYTYNKYNQGDDWLFSAPIHLQSEQYYDLLSNVAARMTYYRERFEVFVCNAQHPDSIVATVRPATETDKDKVEERRFYTYNDCFCVPAEGDYYLAFHCISDPNQLDFEIHSLELTKGAVFDAPAAADNVVFRAGSMGSVSGNVDFDAPTKSIRGEELTSLTKAELYNGEYLCATLTDIEPGKRYTLVDGSAQRGFNSYRLLIYNEYGKGLPSTATIFVGPDTPAAPENVKIALEGDKVHITWDPVVIGEHGGYIDPSKISYVVVRQQDIETVYAGTDPYCYDNTLVNRGAQTDYYYGVFAYYGTTPSEGTPTKDVVLGTPYRMPFEETFAGNSGQTTLWLIGYDPYNTIGTNWSVGELPSYDGEPGNLTCKAYYDEGGYHFLSSGKIQVTSTAQHPVLTFPYMCAGLDDKIDVMIATHGVTNDGEIVKTLHPTQVGNWDMARIDLTPYKGTNIIVTWHCYLAEAGDIVLDDIRVYDDTEASIAGIEADSSTPAATYDLQGRRVQPGKADGFVLAPSSKRLILNKK